MEENIQETGENTSSVEQQSKNVAPVEPASSVDNGTDANLIKLRAAKKAEQERADRLEAELEELRKKKEEALKEREPEYSAEDFIEGRHLRSFEDRQAKELQEIKKRQQEFEIKQREAAEASELRRKFTDFSSVMTDENADKLRELDPETFMTIANSSASFYQRSVAAYKRIKELGIYVEDNFKKDRATAEANVNKPRPMNSVSPQQGNSPLSMANAFSEGRLTEEKKNLLWKEMQEAMRKQ